AETGAVMSMKAAPPVTVTGAMLAGVAVDDWIKWATLLYVVMMITHKGWHMFKEWKSGRESSE
ncbi:MAG TPA: hypothetical protein VJ654_14690, partial [Noviherbaspirillum sp.]|nr:hypothetical protein [Noviherbaspirillum sp.]